MEITKTQRVALKARTYKYFILHVEDDESVGNVVARHLDKSGYRVTAARTAREGMEKFLNDVNQWNAVIMDLLLPDVNGISLFSDFRKHRPDMPILVLSGDITEPSLLLMGGATIVLAKPLRAQDLIEGLEALFAFPACPLPE